jgi:hypothetical protein
LEFEQSPQSAYRRFAIRPLSTTMLTLPRPSVSILKVIDQAMLRTSPSRMSWTAGRPAGHRSHVVQPRGQLDVIENRL